MYGLQPIHTPEDFLKFQKEQSKAPETDADRMRKRRDEIRAELSSNKDYLATIQLRNELVKLDDALTPMEKSGDQKSKDTGGYSVSASQPFKHPGIVFTKTGRDSDVEIMEKNEKALRKFRQDELPDLPGDELSTRAARVKNLEAALVRNPDNGQVRGLLAVAKAELSGFEQIKADRSRPLRLVPAFCR